MAEVNGRIFLNNSSIGVYPSVVELRNRYGGQRAGQVDRGAVGLTRRAAPPAVLGVRIRTDEETVVRSTPFVFVGNNEYRMVGLRRRLA